VWYRDINVFGKHIPSITRATEDVHNSFFWNIGTYISVSHPKKTDITLLLSIKAKLQIKLHQKGLLIKSIPENCGQTMLWLIL
jgi:hypothetical protein